MLQIQAADASAQQIRVLQSVSPKAVRVTESHHQSEQEEKVTLRGFPRLYFLPSCIDHYMNISDLTNILICLVSQNISCLLTYTLLHAFILFVVYILCEYL